MRIPMKGKSVSVCELKKNVMNKNRRQGVVGRQKETYSSS